MSTSLVAYTWLLKIWWGMMIVYTWSLDWKYDKWLLFLEGILKTKNIRLLTWNNSKRSNVARITDLKERLRMPLTDNIWNSMIKWPLNLLSVIITVRYHFFKSLYLPYFVRYLWRPNFRPCTWSAKVWHVYDRAGTWSTRGQNSRSTYSVSP